MTTRLFSNPRPHFTLDDGATSNINGKLYFYEPGIGSTTLKYVYSKSPFTTANRLTNPVNLDGNGFAPTIRLDGDYRVKLTDVNGVTIWDVPNYQEAEPEGQYTEWSASLTYAVNDIVRYTDGNYYQSITSNNTGNTPSSSSSFWVKIFFITLWNTNRSYAVGEYAERSGEIYRSLTAHSGSDPLTSRTNWERVTAGDFDTWDSAYTYVANNSVFYNGKYYQAIAGSTGQTPSNSAFWNEIQILFLWNTDATYSVDQVVVYSGSLYRSLAGSNTGNQPDTSPSEWRDITGVTSGEYAVVKLANQQKTTDTTAAADSELAGITVPVGRYVLDMTIFATAASATPNIKIAFRVSSGSHSSKIYGEITPNSLGNVQGRSLSTGTTSSWTIGAARSIIRYSGLFEAISESTVEMIWAQDTSSADATTVESDSFLRLRRII